MSNISKYIWRIISILLLCWSNLFFSVAEEKNEQKKFFYGFSVDFDLADPILSLINSDRFGLNASIEVDLFHRIFPVFEMGYGIYDAESHYAYIPDEIVQGDDYKYNIQGFYYKIGANINLLKGDRSKSLNPTAYLGARYGFSPFQYKIENLVVKDLNWDQTYLFDAKGTTIGQWAEFLAGVKTPIYKNLCLGVEVRFKQFLHVQKKKTDNKVIHQTYSPGFGDKNKDKWGFRYTISYFFPL